MVKLNPALSKMFAIAPAFRRNDEFGRLRLVDELTNPWDFSAPMLSGNGTLPNLSGRLGDSEIQNTDKEFCVCLDLCHYSPEEIRITSDNNKITINAKHEEKQDNHGYISRQMVRTYKLPDDVDPKSVTSTMNSQGTLNIKVTKRAIEVPKDVQIPVEFKE